MAVLRGDSKVTGTVTFEQSSESSPTTISYDITGHDASTERGMHVHQFGDNTNGCTSAGPHCKDVNVVMFSWSRHFAYSSTSASTGEGYELGGNRNLMFCLHA